MYRRIRKIEWTIYKYNKQKIMKEFKFRILWNKESNDNYDFDAFLSYYLDVDNIYKEKQLHWKLNLVKYQSESELYDKHIIKYESYQELFNQLLELRLKYFDWNKEQLERMFQIFLFLMTKKQYFIEHKNDCENNIQHLIFAIAFYQIWLNIHKKYRIIEEYLWLLNNDDQNKRISTSINDYSSHIRYNEVSELANFFHLLTILSKHTLVEYYSNCNIDSINELLTEKFLDFVIPQERKEWNYWDTIDLTWTIKDIYLDNLKDKYALIEAFNMWYTKLSLLDLEIENYINNQ